MDVDDKMVRPAVHVTEVDSTVYRPYVAWERWLKENPPPPFWAILIRPRRWFDVFSYWRHRRKAWYKYLWKILFGFLSYEPPGSLPSRCQSYCEFIQRFGGEPK